MKQVRETKAGKSISAWVITRDARHVATVQAHYGNSGRVQVDVWHNSTMRDGTFPELQQASASGYGYDKFTAALRGMKIDGITLHDHAESAKKGSMEGLRGANWNAATKDYDNYFYLPGLEILTALGYTVIQAI
jgi:hypothetical protein